MSAAWCAPPSWLSAAIALGLILQGSTESRATPDSASAEQVTESSGPYCGVHCLYAALDAIGKDARFEELISTKYISSERGSSAADLQSAAADFGAHGTTMTRLTADTLRSSRHPVILHVKPIARSAAYTHWMLFLGMDDGKARILDPPKQLEVVPMAHVLARWDGIGIVIHDSNAVGLSVWPARAMFGSLAVIAACAIWLIRLLRSPSGVKRLGARRDLCGLVGVLCVSVAIALIWHGVSPEGFLLNRSAVASVVANFHSAAVPHLTIDELEALRRNGDAVLIDARRPQAYRRGHIDGAINVPVTSSLSSRDRALGHLPKTSRIVLYCQSERCPWASELANLLTANGYSDLSLFPGGWQEWSKALAQKTPSTRETNHAQ
jgi:rhodanese-related sulfurtransferase